MKRNFLFIFFAVIAVNLTAAEPAQGIAYYKAGFSQVAKPLLLNEYTADTLTRSETCFYLGNIYFGENKPDSAAIYFKKGLIGKQVNVLNTIGLAMLKMKSNAKEADSDIQLVLKLQPRLSIMLVVAAAVQKTTRLAAQGVMAAGAAGLVTLAAGMAGLTGQTDLAVAAAAVQTGLPGLVARAYLSFAI